MSYLVRSSCGYNNENGSVTFVADKVKVIILLSSFIHMTFLTKVREHSINLLSFILRYFQAHFIVIWGSKSLLISPLQIQISI